MAIAEQQRLVHLCLYTAGTASAPAVAAALRGALDEHLAQRYELETIDLDDRPAAMKDCGLVALPTLVRTSPAPARKVFGDLGAIPDVLAALRIEPVGRRPATAGASRPAPGGKSPGGGGVSTRQAEPAELTETCLREIVERTRDGKLVVDDQGVLRFMNPAAERLLERSADELLGRTVGVPLVRAETARCRIVCGDGSLRVVELSASDFDWGGQRGRIASLRDVTERAALHDQREGLLEELQAKNAELERFVYSVSHDLKSPLVTVTGFLGLVERDVARGSLDRLPSHVSRAAGAAARMQAMIDDLLELSRIGRGVNMAVEVPLGELANEVVANLAGPIAQRGVTVRIAPDLPIVRGDRARLLGLLQNLVDNAVKFSGDQPGREVEIGSRQNGGQSVCYIRDNGIGLEPRFRERVFGLFEQLKPATEGTGAGLAIAKRIVELHGGRIWIESEGPGKGCTVCFTLPTPEPSSGRGPAEPNS